jgi:hypothetical protein
MTPEQMATLKAVQQDLARTTAGAGMARTAGSDTAQNLASQNLLAQTLGPKLAKMTSVQTLGRPAQFILSRAEPKIQDQIIKALENPQYAAQLMNEAKKGGNAAKVVAVLIRMAAVGAGTTAAQEE